MENFIQGNDPRKNIEKPKTTWQKAYDMDMGKEKPVRVLEVHVNDNPESDVYFRGIPEAYKGGAVYRENLPDDFVGDPAEEIKEEE